MLRQGNRDSLVVYSRKFNWFLSMQECFVEDMVDEISRFRPKQNQKIYVRLHASGDFYSEEYLEKWMKIALVTKLMGKDYTFVAYTKSYEILDCVLSDQTRLNGLYKEAYQMAGKTFVKKETLTLEDFNLHLIASYMDDTKAVDKQIAKKWELPVYFVTSIQGQQMTDCVAQTCAECMKCYTFPMQDVTTILRK